MTEIRNKTKRKFIKQLQENPLVTLACQKIGTSRSTYYRWLSEDTGFRQAAEAAAERGREKMNDLAESKLLENVTANYHPSIAYWLSNNSKQYQRPTTVLHFRENERLSSMLKSQQDIIDWLTNIVGQDKVVEMLGEGSLDTFLQKAKKHKEINQKK